MDYLNLYTLQHENTLFELNSKGRITNKEIYLKLHFGDIQDLFLPQYRWFTQMASLRIPKPADVDYAIWCGVTQKGSMKPEEKQILYCLKVPVEEVVYFDGRKWDYVLNSLYLPKNEADQNKFQKELTDRGIRTQFGFLKNFGRMYPDISSKIRSSWERIFEIEDWDEHFIQAAVWEIRKEWVQHIVRPGEDLFKAAEDMENTFVPVDAKINK